MTNRILLHNDKNGDEYEKEFLIFSLSTMTSLVFIEFIPDIINEKKNSDPKILGGTIQKIKSQIINN